MYQRQQIWELFDKGKPSKKGGGGQCVNPKIVKALFVVAYILTFFRKGGWTCYLITNFLLDCGYILQRGRPKFKHVD